MGADHKFLFSPILPFDKPMEHKYSAVLFSTKNLVVVACPTLLLQSVFAGIYLQSTQMI